MDSDRKRHVTREHRDGGRIKSLKAEYSKKRHRAETGRGR